MSIDVFGLPDCPDDLTRVNDRRDELWARFENRWVRQPDLREETWPTLLLLYGPVKRAPEPIEVPAERFDVAKCRKVFSDAVAKYGYIDNGLDAVLTYLKMGKE